MNKMKDDTPNYSRPEHFDYKETFGRNIINIAVDWGLSGGFGGHWVNLGPGGGYHEYT